MAAPQISHLDPPFIQVEGVFNFRSVGGYTIPSNSLLRVKPNLLFRSGELTGITAAGAETLASLNVTTIFDLRAKNETKEWQTSTPHLANIKIVHAPVEQEVSFDHNFLTDFFRKFETDELQAFLDTYQESLANLGPALETSIRHITEHPEHPFVVHCTAGKDRTGILVAVILLLLGVSEADIIQDYVLTEIGLKPALGMLAARVSKIEAFRNNPVGAQNMAKSRAETMAAMIEIIQDKYGGAEQYTLQNTNLTKGDLEEFRNSALVKVQTSN